MRMNNSPEVMAEMDQSSVGGWPQCWMVVKEKGCLRQPTGCS